MNKIAVILNKFDLPGFPELTPGHYKDNITNVVNWLAGVKVKNGDKIGVKAESGLIIVSISDIRLFTIPLEVDNYNVVVHDAAINNKEDRIMYGMLNMQPDFNIMFDSTEIKVFIEDTVTTVTPEEAATAEELLGETLYEVLHMPNDHGKVKLMERLGAIEILQGGEKDGSYPRLATTSMNIPLGVLRFLFPCHTLKENT